MRKQCKRKVWPLLNPISHAIEGARITPAKELDALRMRELSAVEAFAHGQATQQDFHDLCALQNLCVTMAANSIGAEAMDSCDTARDALNDARIRHESTGKWGMTGPGLLAMNDLFAWHDAQRMSVARSVYERMVEQTVHRVRDMRVTA